MEDIQGEVEIILEQLEDILGEVEIILEQGINLQIMLNLPLMIMTMMFTVITVLFLINLDGGTTAAMTSNQTFSHLSMIG